MRGACSYRCCIPESLVSLSAASLAAGCPFPVFQVGVGGENGGLPCSKMFAKSELELKDPCWLPCPQGKDWLLRISGKAVRIQKEGDAGDFY